MVKMYLIKKYTNKDIRQVFNEQNRVIPRGFFGGEFHPKGCKLEKSMTASLQILYFKQGKRTSPEDFTQNISN